MRGAFKLKTKKKWFENKWTIAWQTMYYINVSIIFYKIENTNGKRTKRKMDEQSSEEIIYYSLIISTLGTIEKLKCLYIDWNTSSRRIDSIQAVSSSEAPIRTGAHGSSRLLFILFSSLFNNYLFNHPKHDIHLFRFFAIQIEWIKMNGSWSHNDAVLSSRERKLFCTTQSASCVNAERFNLVINFDANIGRQTHFKHHNYVHDGYLMTPCSRTNNKRRAVMWTKFCFRMNNTIDIEIVTRSTRCMRNFTH